ncbi:MAG: T9SS type A sorting domain-containing protein [Bacteroidales bacterium]|nr:T9SS type A sorting domain-containing protein [Bacteroidales bacterium]
MRLDYNEVDDEFGIIIYGNKSVINIDPQTGTINSTDWYTQYGSPVMIKYDVEGKPIVMTLSIDDIPGHLIRDGEAIELPATPTYFDYSPQAHKAVVCMPGPDYVTIVEYGPNTNPPTADFTANVTTIYVGESVEFTDLTLNNPETWEWNFEGGNPLTSADQNPVVTYDGPGSFDVSLTATNTNGSDTETKADYITVEPLVFVSEKGIKTEISLSPNPTEDIVNVSVSGKALNPISVHVFSVEGRLVFSQKIIEESSIVDLSGCKKGLYFLKLEIEGDTRSFKIFKK